MQKYYLFNFNGYTISISMEDKKNEKSESLKEKATILAQAEAIKQHLDYKNFSSKEIKNVEYMVLTTHMKLSAN